MRTVKNMAYIPAMRAARPFSMILRCVSVQKPFLSQNEVVALFGVSPSWYDNLWTTPSNSMSTLNKGAVSEPPPLAPFFPGTLILLVLGGFWGVGASGEGLGRLGGGPGGPGGPGGGPGGPGDCPGALEVVDLEVARSRTSMRIVYYF